MNRWFIWVGRGIFLVIALFFIALAAIIGIYQIFGYSFVAGTRPEVLGLESGRLAPCPNPPVPRWRAKRNCVSSLDFDTEYYIEPIKFEAALEDSALSGIAASLAAHPQITIISQQDEYLHFEWASQLFGFVDDVELWWQQDESRIDVRSSSRLGRRDFGANRHHIEWLRAVLKMHRHEILFKPR